MYNDGNNYNYDNRSAGYRDHAYMFELGKGGSNIFQNKIVVDQAFSKRAWARRYPGGSAGCGRSPY